MTNETQGPFTLVTYKDVVAGKLLERGVGLEEPLNAEDVTALLEAMRVAQRAHDMQAFLEILRGIRDDKSNVDHSLDLQFAIVMVESHMCELGIESEKME